MKWTLLAIAGIAIMTVTGYSAFSQERIHPYSEDTCWYASYLAQCTQAHGHDCKAVAKSMAKRATMNIPQQCLKEQHHG